MVRCSLYTGMMIETFTQLPFNIRPIL